MWQLILYISPMETKNVGSVKTYPKAFAKYERLTEKYPERHYALRKV